MVSLGCPKNLVDSEVMLGLAQQAGHELTRDPAGAEVLIVNTCAFIDKAKQESVDAILEMAEFKKTGACKTLVVAGCLAERYRDELKAQIPEIDAILGTGDVPAIVEALGGPAAPARARVGVESSRSFARVVRLSPRNPGAFSLLRLRCPLCLLRSGVDRLCRPISTTPRRLASSRRRGITRTSRSPRAATTSAASASSRSCAATTAAAPTTRSCAKPRRSPHAA